MRYFIPLGDRAFAIFGAGLVLALILYVGALRMIVGHLFPIHFATHKIKKYNKKLKKAYEIPIGYYAEYSYTVDRVDGFVIYKCTKNEFDSLSAVLNKR